LIYYKNLRTQYSDLIEAEFKSLESKYNNITLEQIANINKQVAQEVNL